MATGPGSQRSQQEPTLINLLVATIVGMLAIIVSLIAFNIMIGEEATEAAVHSRTLSYIYWTQPFIYVMAGLLAGARDSRWGPRGMPSS